MNKKFTLLGRKAKIKKLMATIAVASIVSSITVTGFGEAAFAATAPPATWQEHWFEHNQNLKLAYYNDDIAVYLDDDINKSNVTWVNSYMTDVWKYVKKTYGQMGGDGRLYIILHNKYGGGHPSDYYDASHDYRNVIDVAGSDFKSNTGWNLDAITHEVSHIVESATYGTRGCPAFNIWKDSKWAEIFNYDVYNALGMSSDAQRAYNNCMKGTDSFPKEGTAWFKNWFYPIWNQYGKTNVLNNYFKILSERFPKDSNGRYTRDMNMGEFVYFWSLAANTDLKQQATTAFGWNDDYEKQLKQAHADFDGAGGVTFYQDINYGGKAVSLTPGTYTLAQLQAKGIPNDWVSSVRVPSGYSVTIYNDDNFSGTSKTITSDNPSMVATGNNDMMTSVKITATAATFYENINYGGKSVALAPGTYTLAQLQAKGISNDWVSSVKVPSGLTVTIYSDDNFLGLSLPLTSDNPTLVSKGFNDAMSSVKITAS